MMSLLPPGACGTISRIDRAGYFSESAAPSTGEPDTASAASIMIRDDAELGFMDSSRSNDPGVSNQRCAARDSVYPLRSSCKKTPSAHAHDSDLIFFGRSALSRTQTLPVNNVCAVAL